MKTSSVLWVLQALASAKATATHSTSHEQDCLTIACRQDALAFAFAYAYPWWAYAQLSLPIPNATANHLYHNRDMATPGAIGVVRPNANTLYSTLFIDLSKADLVLAVPKFPEGRYWVFPISNPYGDNLANIGSITNNTEGDYLIRYDPINYGVVKTPGRSFAGIIYLPSAYGIALLRVRSKSDENDLAEARGLQAGFKIRERGRRSSPIAPPLVLDMFRDAEFSVEKVHLYELVLKLAAKLAPYNLPYIVGDRAWVNNTIRNAGISDGHFAMPEGVNLTAATAASNSSAQALLSLPGISINLGNGWTMRSPQAIGKYGSFYNMRYLLASRGYLALTSEQVLYPSYTSDINLKQGQSAIVEFASRPKILPGGFWSLTAYDKQGYLVQNLLGRYSLGGGDNLTYPDGQRVADSDQGVFQILLQGTDVEPPSNWTSNWLPVAPGPTTVSITLRFYGADGSMGDGTYEYPLVRIIDSVRG